MVCILQLLLICRILNWCAVKLEYKVQSGCVYAPLALALFLCSAFSLRTVWQRKQ